MINFIKWLKKAIQLLNGDIEYERYLQHFLQHHQGLPLSRKAFFAEKTKRKWNGVKRCC
jgi:uncharacterized short protein YbdD (DUF466 family)